MCAELTSLAHCALDNDSQQTVAVFKGKAINKAEFNIDVRAYVSAFIKLKNEHFALFYEEAYLFSVSFFALLHSGKKIWIAGNNKQATAEKLTKQGCLLLGEWQGQELIVEPEQVNDCKLIALDINIVQLNIFTSGSSAESKVISKCLRQFQSEIEYLEQQWGGLLDQAQVLATVSHQHIYGLIFRLLWPLASGRIFHSQMFLSPEPLLKAAYDIKAYWVASPAQLKRLDEYTQWNEIAGLIAIFSSGGTLSIEVASKIQSRSEHKVLQVYGSSETGGIAWRQGVDNNLWTPFDGVCITRITDGQHQISSPYLSEQTPIILDDKIDLQINGQFALLGRQDRIIKVEEKRLSLDELENSINQSDWVQQAHSLLLTDKRDKIATVLSLTEEGNQYLQQQGRTELIKQLRKYLMHSFETVVLPRKWIFMRSIPLTTLGKINQGLLLQLFSLDTDRFPQILQCDFQQDKVELQLRVQPGLVYFPGHFPEQPILPGVTQLFWVETFGKLFFIISLPFLRMEVIKFKKIIRPGDFINMQISWKADTGKLYFDLSSDNDLHSSGRIVYGEQE